MLYLREYRRLSFNYITVIFAKHPSPENVNMWILTRVSDGEKYILPEIQWYTSVSNVFWFLSAFLFVAHPSLILWICLISLNCPCLYFHLNEFLLINDVLINDATTAIWGTMIKYAYFLARMNFGVIETYFAMVPRLLFPPFPLKKTQNVRK